MSRQSWTAFVDSAVSSLGDDSADDNADAQMAVAASGEASPTARACTGQCEDCKRRVDFAVPALIKGLENDPSQS